MLLVVVDPVPLALTATPVSRLSSRQPVPTKMLGNQAHGTPTRLGDRRVAEECDLRRATSGEKWTTPPRAETRRLELQWRESQPRPTRRWSLHFSLRPSLPSMLPANGSGHGSGQRAAGSCHFGPTAQLRRFLKERFDISSHYCRHLDPPALQQRRDRRR